MVVSEFNLPKVQLLAGDLRAAQYSCLFLPQWGFGPFQWRASLEGFCTSGLLIDPTVEKASQPEQWISAGHFWGFTGFPPYGWPLLVSG